MLCAFKLLTPRDALSEGITGQFGRTRTDRIVIDHGALRPDAACSGTGIYAFLIIAGHIRGTVGANNALGSAIGRCVQISGDARADRLLVYLSALAVRSTRRWIARVFRYRHCVNILRRARLLHGEIIIPVTRDNIDRSQLDYFRRLLAQSTSTCYWVTHYERIARHSWRTSANRYVIYDCTQGAVTADTVARISTSVPNAGSIPQTVRIQKTFRTASQIRVALIFRKASANTIKTLRICAAIQARIRWFECRI